MDERQDERFATLKEANAILRRVKRLKELVGDKISDENRVRVLRIICACYNEIEGIYLHALRIMQ